MSEMSRRTFLEQGSAVLAAAMGGGPALSGSLRKAQAAKEGPSATDPGPENPPLRDSQPDTFLPPVTDHGEVPTFWNSFSSAHRRIQEGGWSRQVTVEDFPISTTIAGVNMRLTAGGVRELHWHAAAEWAIMLAGRARITAVDGEGRGFVKDVGKNDLWLFPEGLPHSIQGLPPDGCEFLLVFDDGKFSEANTTLLSDWLRHTPPEVLAKNWGVAEAELKGVYEVPPEGHYIFPAPVTRTEAEDRARIAAGRGLSPTDFSFSLDAMRPSMSSRSGEVKIVDSRNFPVSKAIAAAYVVIRPGGLRELHWHPNADEWLYIVQGKGRMTLFINSAKARTADFAAGDVGYAPITLPHYLENTGDEDLIYLEMFKSDQFQDISLSQWVLHTPPELVKAHLNITDALLAKIPRGKPAVVPA